MSTTENDTPFEWDGELTAAKALSRIAVELEALADEAESESARFTTRAAEVIAEGLDINALHFQSDALICARYALRMRSIALAASL